MRQAEAKKKKSEAWIAVSRKKCIRMHGWRLKQLEEISNKMVIYIMYTLSKLFVFQICFSFYFEVFRSTELGGSFKYFLFWPLFGEGSHFDYISQRGWNHRLDVLPLHLKNWLYESLCSPKRFFCSDLLNFGYFVDRRMKS